MNKIKFLDLLPFIYYGSWIRVEVQEEDYGRSIIYTGRGGRIFEKLNVNTFNNYVVQNISNGLDGNSPMTIFLLEGIE